jgi:hypothetical protein
MNRDSVVFKPITLVTLFVFLYQIIFPSLSLALTSGPTQPETQSFSPAGGTDLVDPFTGDFSYNIPLMDVGGYPIGLSYTSGVTMEQEATWVGLGWNINPGVINRNVRGLPDDFKGDEVVKELNIKANRTYGAGASVSLELVGLDIGKKVAKIGFGVGAKFNNYSGVALDLQLSPSIGASASSKSKFTSSLGFDMSLGNSGASASPSISFSKNVEGIGDNGGKINTKIGSSFNSRSGLQAVNFSSGLSYNQASTAKATNYEKNEDGTDSDVLMSSGSVTRSMSMAGGMVSFASPSYTPSISSSFKNRSFSLSTSIVGIEAFGANPQALRINGYYSDQVLAENRTESPSFGYLYYQDGAKRSDAVLDFNREKDLGYSKEVKNLPITSATYDIFSVSGEGIGGSYRLFRNDVGTVYDNTNKNTTNGLSIGGPEFALGPGAVKGGVNVAVNTAYTSSHKWETGNSTSEILTFKGRKTSNQQEPVYFRKSGEKNAMSNRNFFDSFGDFEAIAFDLEKETSLLAAKRTFTDTKDRSFTLPKQGTANLNTERQARNEAIVHYSAIDAAKYGMFKQIRNYPNGTADDFTLNTNGTFNTSSKINRYETNDLTALTARKGHHLSEINVFSGDGRRYVYSDPIYNFVKEEVTFATNHNSGEQVGYTSQDESKHNKNGLDNYYNKVVTPAYPTAFLLSAIVSSDYLDIDEVEGPSDEDLGTYTKFNYTKLNTYQWRTPVEAGKAILNKGFKTKSSNASGDNKANYVFGQKEVKYLHSIETKTHVAEFVLEDRTDGSGVVGRRGGINNSTSQLKRLKEIRLFAKADKLNNPDGASPIKTVHFEYDYSLCHGVYNNSGNGKLTLTKVHFTYGASKRGKLSPYTFTYESNPGYQRNSNDRWGNYQENTEVPDNTEYPYTSQEHTGDDYVADNNSAAWSLSKIDLPSGGFISVEYEADDYAFVQDKKAMQMFRIAGFSETETGDPAPYLYGNTCNLPLRSACSRRKREYLKIKIPSNYPTPDGSSSFSAADFMKSNGKQIRELYFKMFVNIEDEYLDKLIDPSAEKREYIFGYAEVDTNWEPRIIGGYLTMKIKEKDGCNQVSLATFNLMKKNFPEIVYQQDRPGELGVERIFNVLLGSVRALKDLVIGTENSLKLRMIGKSITPEKSWVRLYNPNGFKKGGGHRVKKVTIDDNWAGMAKFNNESSQYGQEYDYTMNNDYGRTISSGVAAYEPILGNEENPFRQPRFYDRKKLLVPDEEFYSEEPMGEGFFPGASVGYRKVTIKNLTRANILNSTTGKTVKEFYTAYDFPTIAKEKSMIVARRKPISILKLFNLSNKDYVSTSQGYVVELNDMHGKQKAEWVYQEDDASPYSGVEYKYKQLSNKQIASEDLVVDKSGNISKKLLGVEMDLIADVRQSYSSTISASGDINNDFFVVPAPIPIPINLFSIWPSYSNEITRFSSIVTNKVVKRHGLLKETIYYSQKSKVGITKNLIRDAESGEVLLTQTENEFGDALYSFNYPAYWAYDNMGPVYKTMDISVLLNDGAEVNQFLKVGDQVIISGGSEPKTAWVSVLNGSSTKFIDKDGIPIKNVLGSHTVKVINPINTNQQAQTVGSVITKKNPARDSNGSGEPDKLIFEDVLQASAMEYTEQAAVFCNCGPVAEGTPTNPYTKGTKGLWKPWREFNYLTDRTQTRKNKDLNTREDGEYVEFVPFWSVNAVAGRDWQPNYDQWIYTAEASTFNPYGKELESKDALGRYSSALFGYNHALPTAVAKNARYQHIAFDGFEDYGTEGCDDDHFSFEKLIADQHLSKDEAHSGKKSIMVTPAGSGAGGGKFVLRKVLVECEK